MKIYWFILLTFVGQLVQSQTPPNFDYSKLSTRQKIAQLMMVAVHPNADSAHLNQIERQIERDGVGGVIFFKGTPQQYVQVGNRLRKASHLPLWLAIDGEWGLAMRINDTFRYPFQITLGALQTNELIEQMGYDIARQMKRLGLHINFSPVADINNNPHNPVINYRSFGQNKQNVAQKSVAYMRGLKRGGVMPVGKHFPGHGDTEHDSHLTLPIINHSWHRLDSLELYPFRQLIADSIDAIMTAHLHVPALDTAKNISATLSQKIVTTLLKNKLNYNGLIFTDALNMEGVAGYFEPGQIEYKALMAGCDVLLVPQNAHAAIEYLANKANTDNALLGRINQSFERVVAKKQALNLNLELVPEKNLIADLNHYSFKKTLHHLFAQSITLLQNNNNAVPLSLENNPKIASILIGSVVQNSFQNRLSDYATIIHFQLKRDAKATAFDTVLQQLKTFDQVIVGVVNTDQRSAKNYGLTPQVIDFLNKISTSGKAIVVYFGNPYALNKLKHLHKAQAVLVTYQETHPMPDLAAQAIFGGIALNAKLPVSVNNHYKINQGLQTHQTRLSFGTMAHLGWNEPLVSTKIDSIINNAIANQAFPGCQILVAKNQHVVLQKSYGHFTYNKKHAVANNSIYDLASVTKILGPLPALMKLTEQHQIGLDDPLSKHWWRLWWSNKRKVTFRNALTHQAGLTAWIPFWKSLILADGSYKKNSLSTDSSATFSVRAAQNLYVHNNYRKKIYTTILRSDIQPNQEYKYSDLSFYLYPKIIENLTNQNYSDYLNRHFYQKLGATTLGYLPRQQFMLSQIVPTERDTFFRMQLLHGDVHDEGSALMGGISGHAGLFASALDVAKIMQMYLNGGSYGGQQFLKKETLAEFTRCQFCQHKNRRALGFDKPLLEKKHLGTPSADASANSYGHSGYTGTFVWNDPDSQLMFIFLSNRVYPNRNYKNLMRLNVRTQIHQLLYNQLASD